MNTQLYTLTYAILFASSGFAFWPGDIGYWMFPVGLIFVWMSVVDSMTFELPDAGQLLLILIAAAFVFVEREVEWEIHIIGALALPCMLWFVASGYQSIRGQVGLGLGDVKLTSGIGMLVGLFDGFWVVGFASLAGMLFVLAFCKIFNIKPAKPTEVAVAFGPFLCLSAWAIWLWGIQP